MLTASPITPGMPKPPQLEALYTHAFPSNERRPLAPLFDDVHGVSDVLAFYDEGEFIGFACLLSWQDITHIIYFAIEPSKRDKGYGSQALRLINERYPNRRILADVEADDPAALNNEERGRRRAFYLRNGYRPTAVRYGWRHERWEILCHGGDVSEAEFDLFWDAMGRVGLAAY